MASAPDLSPQPKSSEAPHREQTLSCRSGPAADSFVTACHRSCAVRLDCRYLSGKLRPSLRGDLALDRSERTPMPGAGIIAAFAALVASITPAPAQDWPTKPVTMLYPFAAGSAADVLGRV